MKKWDVISREYLTEDKTKCYWFWFKGKITRKRDKESGNIYEQNLTGKLQWNGIRLKNGFYNCLENLNMKSGKYNGQTKAEFEKNYKRVKDIFEKSDGDVNKASQLSKTQANRITDEWKAINRAMSAKKHQYGSQKEQEIFEAIFEEFFNRAYQLGSVSKQEYREYKLERLGI
jgi:hypothetical protein